MKTITHNGTRYNVVTETDTTCVVDLPAHQIHGHVSRMQIPKTSTKSMKIHLTKSIEKPEVKAIRQAARCLEKARRALRIGVNRANAIHRIACMQVDLASLIGDLQKTKTELNESKPVREWDGK